MRGVAARGLAKSRHCVSTALGVARRLGPTRKNVPDDTPPFTGRSVLGFGTTPIQTSCRRAIRSRPSSR